MQKYQPTKLEEKWQKRWEDQGLYKTSFSSNDKTDLDRSGKKFYVLAEFPYPSGDLHMGHWFTFTGADIYARFKRMQGYNVFFPNGFDAFGLPAENAAIKRGIHPQDWTLSNVEKMKQQFKTTGGSFTFDHEVITCLPEYYQWNQWIFNKMFEKGLAYRGKYLSNWCETDQTVLANEGVVDGMCWRCGNPVVQKEVEQWFLRITDYAERLIWEASPKVDWPKSVRDAQNIWIGRKEGIVISYDVEDSDKKVLPAARLPDGQGRQVEVFTTRPDTNFGATFIALAPEHPLVLKVTTEENKASVQAYLKQASKKSEIDRKENKEKTGVFTGAYAINDLTGYKMPIWVSDFVLMGFGTGALVGVPGHDTRDFEFAKKFKLEIIRVVVGKDGNKSEIKTIEQVQEEEGTMINSQFLDGLDIHEATTKIMDYIEEKGWGKRQVEYHIHDWSISRQRYWGTPVPMVHCPDCGINPVPDTDLPVTLPYEVDYTPKGKSPLASNEEWLKVKCPKCGKDGRRDDETLDTFMDSSWYFFRYISPKYEKGPFDPKLAKKIMPVDVYFGGAEHTLGHTLYSRFFTKFFKDLGLTDINEYAQRRVNHGIVLGPDGQKMSKSRGNVVNPDEEVKKYGSDAVRVHVAFFIPYDGVGPWISERIWGPYHFLERVWELYDKVSQEGKVSQVSKGEEKVEKPYDTFDTSPTFGTLSKADLYEMGKAIKNVSEDIEAIKFNTGVSILMEWLNYLSKKEKISAEEYKTFLKLLAPFAPHMTDEIWEMLGEKGSIHISPWPKVNQADLELENFNLVIQVNGRVRDSIEVSSEVRENQAEIERIALNSAKVIKFIGEKPTKKIVYVPGKVINFVI